MMVQLITTTSLLFIVALIVSILPEVSARLDSRPRGLGETYHNYVSAEPVSTPRSVQRRKYTRRKKMRYKKSRKHRTRSFSSGTCFATGWSTCPPGMYCHLFGDSCNSSAEGVCERMSRMCTRIYRPVCGCTGVTYSNACEGRWGQASRGIQAGFKYHGKC